MAINKGLIKEILERLNEVYPGDIEDMGDILPDREDRKEICLHLFHLRDSGYVSFMDFSSKDGKDCGSIKLTPAGVDYLESLS